MNWMSGPGSSGGLPGSWQRIVCFNIHLFSFPLIHYHSPRVITWWISLCGKPFDARGEKNHCRSAFYWKCEIASVEGKAQLIQRCCFKQRHPFTFGLFDFVNFFGWPICRISQQNYVHTQAWGLPQINIDNCSAINALLVFTSYCRICVVNWKKYMFTIFPERAPSVCIQRGIKLLNENRKVGQESWWPLLTEIKKGTLQTISTVLVGQQI